MIRVTLAGRRPGEATPVTHEALWIGNLETGSDDRSAYDYRFGPPGEDREPKDGMTWPRLPGSHWRGDGIWTLVGLVLQATGAFLGCGPVGQQQVMVDLIACGVGVPVPIGAIEIDPVDGHPARIWRYRLVTRAGNGQETVIGPGLLALDTPTTGWALVRRILECERLVPAS